jgi:RND family efflux transporter MFP subunit
MKLLKTFALLVLLAATFAGGYLMRASKRSAPAAGQRRVLYYIDPMHPAYKSDKPGIAPDCGMQLEPVYADGGGSALSGLSPQPPALTPSPVALSPGSTAIHIAPERQQLIGVKFATVEWDGSSRSIRTVGKVTFDETRVTHVHTRIEGWIEKVFVDFTGDVVKTGQPMLTIYSPEMLASQQELLLAVRARDLMKANPLASAAEHGESLFQAAKRRLELWQLSEDQIQQVLTTGEPIHSITVYAPSGGFVSERRAFPNQKVTPDSDLYTITDLSRIWIMADVFESDITSIRVGDRAFVMFPNGGPPSIAAQVNYIQPQVDPLTRTLKVRLDANNPGLRMKPDMFVNVEFGVVSARQLVVPADAVLDTGDRQTVFVDLGDGYLEPRQVVVGSRFGDRLAITSGLTAGERVVSSGTFLIDSESQLKSAAGGMGAPQHQHGATPAAKPMDPSMPMPEPKTPAPGVHRHD